MNQVKFLKKQRVHKGRIINKEVDIEDTTTYIIETEDGLSHRIKERDVLPSVKPSSGGTKHDNGKVRMDLVPVEAIEEIARGFTFGAGKYGDHNWKGGFKYSRLIGSTLRHFYSFVRGDDIDEESGINHLTLVGCNVMMLIYMVKKRSDLDDRYKD